MNFASRYWGGVLSQLCGGKYLERLRIVHKCGKYGSNKKNCAKIKRKKRALFSRTTGDSILTALTEGNTTWTTLCTVHVPFGNRGTFPGIIKTTRFSTRIPQRLYYINRIGLRIASSDISKHRNMEISIYRNIARVLPSFPWHTRVFLSLYAGIELFFRCVQDRNRID